MAVLMAAIPVWAQVPTLRLPSVEVYGERRDVFRPLGNKREGVLWEPGSVRVSEAGERARPTGWLPDLGPMRSRPWEAWEAFGGGLKVEAEGGNLSLGGGLSGGRAYEGGGGMFQASYKKAMEEVQYPGYRGKVLEMEGWMRSRGPGIWAVGEWSEDLWGGREMDDYRAALGVEVVRGDIALRAGRAVLADSVRERYVKLLGRWEGTAGRWRWGGRGCWERAGGVWTGSIQLGVGTAEGRIRGRVGMVWVGKGRGGWLRPWGAVDLLMGRRMRLFLRSSPGVELVSLRKRLQENPFLDGRGKSYLRDRRVDLVGGVRASFSAGELMLFLRYADVDGFPIWRKADGLWKFTPEEVRVEELRGFGSGRACEVRWEVRAVARRATRTDRGRVPYLPDVEGTLGVLKRVWGMEWEVQGSYLGPTSDTDGRWRKPLFLLDLEISRSVGPVEVFLSLGNLSGEREGIWEDEPLPGRELCGGVRWNAFRSR